MPRNDNRGGARKGAGRPKIPRVTVTLDPATMATLTEQARQNRRTPEQHAADLLRVALTAPLFAQRQEATK